MQGAGDEEERGRDRRVGRPDLCRRPDEVRAQGAGTHPHPEAIVPCAVIDGVFNPVNLETAQGKGLAIVCGHRLSDLAEFIEETRSSS